MMKNICLWGTGEIANEVFDNCITMNLYNIIGVIDNDKKKWGESFRGFEIVSPEILNDKHPDAVVVLTDAIKTISEQIQQDYGDDIKIENKNYFYKECMIKRYENSQNVEIRTTIKYIMENGLDIFNAPFIKKYKSIEVDIYRDDCNGLFYVLHNGKKMYFSRKYSTKEMVQNYYKSILIEQDEDSPHRYLSKDFNVKKGDVVVDIGVAEGNFSLEIVDRVSHIYMIEADEMWIEALKYTFKDYSDKVTLIKAFASSYDYGDCVTLDSVIHEPINFIKMDIEGNEWDTLNGAENLIDKSTDLKLALCSYHGDFDQALIEGFLDKHKIRHFTSRGFMWFPWKYRQCYVSTRLNRGIVFGVKNN